MTDTIDDTFRQRPDPWSLLFKQGRDQEALIKDLRLRLWQLMRATRPPMAGDIPEHVIVKGQTTGFQGGDAGHGGCAWVTFAFEGGAHGVELKLRSGEVLAFDLDQVEAVTILAHGDWEQHGLYRALAEAAGRGTGNRIGRGDRAMTAPEVPPRPTGPCSATSASRSAAVCNSSAP
jgi:hypothetical protein